MQAQFTRTVGYWQHLERIIAAKVDAALRSEAARGPLITHLQSLEEIALAECDRRETIQVIASGRRLLGDRRNIGSSNELFSRDVIAVP